MAKLKKLNVSLKKRGRPSKKDNVKNVSLNKIVKKITNTVTDSIKKHNPFKGKGGRKKKEKPLDIDKKTELDKIEFENSFDTEKTDNIKTSSSNPVNGFFYTDEKFIAAFEDDEITKRIQNAYPNFLSQNLNEIKNRKLILKILEDEKIINDILDIYNMTIYDFFKYLFRMDQSLFKTYFISRIQEIVKTKTYAKRTKRQR